MVEPRIVLRQRICRCASCRKLFHICRPCDRGHGYCSQACRLRQRRQQCRAANRRHQQSPEGRADHRDRQRAYRKRLCAARVTDQGRRKASASIRLFPPMAAFSTLRRIAAMDQENGHAKQSLSHKPDFAPVCVRCGGVGRWGDPFHWG